MKRVLPSSLFKSNLPSYLILLLSSSITFDLRTDRLSIILIAFVALAFGLAFRKSGKLNSRVFYVSLPPIFYFIVLSIGILYSIDTSLALSKTETSLPLIVIPLSIFVYLSIEDITDKTNSYLKGYVISSFIAFIYCIVILTINEGVKAEDTAIFDLYSRDNLAKQINIHPVYLSLLNALNLQVLFYLLLVAKEHQRLVTKVFWVICLICSFMFIILLGAKMAMIASVITIFIWISYYIISNKQYFSGLLCLTLLSLTVTLSVNYVPNIKKRFDEIQHTELAPPKGLSHNSTNLRIGQLYCSIEGIKNNLILGTGTGDYQAELNTCYESRDYSNVLYLDDYNSHNQYIQSWLMIGIPGLLLLIFSLAVPLIISLRNKDIFIINVIIVFIFSFLTESVLLTTKGIIAFSFFYMIFMLRFHQHNTRVILSKRLP